MFYTYRGSPYNFSVQFFCLLSKAFLSSPKTRFSTSFLSDYKIQNNSGMVLYLVHIFLILCFLFEIYLSVGLLLKSPGILYDQKPRSDASHIFNKGLNQFKEMTENINKKNSVLLFPVTISTF